MNSNQPVRDNNAVLNNRTLVKEVHGYTRNVVIKVLEKFFAHYKNEDGKTLQGHCADSLRLYESKVQKRPDISGT